MAQIESTKLDKQKNTRPYLPHFFIFSHIAKKKKIVSPSSIGFFKRSCWKFDEPEPSRVLASGVFRRHVLGNGLHLCCTLLVCSTTQSPFHHFPFTAMAAAAAQGATCSSLLDRSRAPSINAGAGTAISHSIFGARVQQRIRLIYSAPMSKKDLLRRREIRFKVFLHTRKKTEQKNN